jgi:hypothetical protein
MNIPKLVHFFAQGIGVNAERPVFVGVISVGPDFRACDTDLIALMWTFGVFSWILGLLLFITAWVGEGFAGSRWGPRKRPPSHKNNESIVLLKPVFIGKLCLTSESRLSDMPSDVQYHGGPSLLPAGSSVERESGTIHLHSVRSWSRSGHLIAPPPSSNSLARLQNVAPSIHSRRRIPPSPSSCRDLCPPQPRSPVCYRR